MKRISILLIGRADASSVFAGTAVSGNDYLDVQVMEGSVIVCGSWIDNASQSASVQCETT